MKPTDKAILMDGERVTGPRKTEALDIQSKALDMAFHLHGSYAPRDPAEAAQFGIKVVVIDVPRPPKMIDVSGNGHRPPEDEE